MKSDSLSRRTFLAACGLLGLSAVSAPLSSVAQASVRISSSLVKVTRTKPLMGTFVTITILHESKTLAEEAIGRAFESMHAHIQIFNRFDSASAVSVLNAHGVLNSAPPELSALLKESKRIHNLTSGAFDPTVKPIIDLFKAKSQASESFEVSRQERDAALALVDAKGVTLSGKSIRFAKPGMGITLDGIAKGFIADKASRVLSSIGAHNHLINAGGDIRLSSDDQKQTPWTVAVQAPKGGKAPSVVHMKNGAVATSGGYEVSFDRHQVHHHIVNPHTARSPHSAQSVTITASTVMRADALSTAVFVLPPRAGFDLIDALPTSEALIITQNGTTLPTRKWGMAHG